MKDSTVDTDFNGPLVYFRAPSNNAKLWMDGGAFVMENTLVSSSYYNIYVYSGVVYMRGIVDELSACCSACVVVLIYTYVYIACDYWLYLYLSF